VVVFENGNDNVCHNQGIFAHRPKLPVAEDCNSKDLKRQVVVMFEDVIWNDNVCHNQGNSPIHHNYWWLRTVTPIWVVTYKWCLRR